MIVYDPSTRGAQNSIWPHSMPNMYRLDWYSSTRGQSHTVQNRMENELVTGRCPSMMECQEVPHSQVVVRILMIRIGLPSYCHDTRSVNYVLPKHHHYPNRGTQRLCQVLPAQCLIPHVLLCGSTMMAEHDPILTRVVTPGFPEVLGVSGSAN